MLKIEKFVTASPEQWEIIIEGMRNPKNSWDRMDSYATHIEDPETLETADYAYFIGPNDQTLMETLAKGGPVHAKYRRMIPVWLTLTAPLYWWKEFDTYKVGTVANSCSTMHKIHSKEFTFEDFSREHLIDNWVGDNGESIYSWVCPNLEQELFASPNDGLRLIIGLLNANREAYLKYDDMIKNKHGSVPFDEAVAARKKYWWQMIQLLPSSYNQKRTVMLNYEVLHNIYVSRKDHKLDEWHVFCDWIRELPYSELITGEE